MITEQFLSRVVGPGNYACIAWKSPSRNMAQRFYPRDKLAEAAKDLQYWAGRGADAYYALAGFKDANPELDKNGRQILRGLRTQDNAQAFRGFWLDLDVARPGDGKDPTQVYTDRAAAIAWLMAFVAATGLPLPNMMVDSGYGYHVYWLLEQSLTKNEWRPYADALKVMMVANGYIGDLQRVADAASVLRPPQTFNIKSGQKVPINVLGAKDDIPNALMLDVIRPHLSTTVVAEMDDDDALAGGPDPAFAGINAPDMNAAAKLPTGIDKKQEFKHIAAHCAQVKRSLAVGGLGDAYPLWYQGFMLLSRFCVDGDHYAHEISKGDPRYNEAKVNATLAVIDKSVKDQDLGPPRCTSMDNNRPGVCRLCPHWGKILSPWNLGSPAGDLPANYRHNATTGHLEHRFLFKDPENKGEFIHEWKPIMSGDVWRPVVDALIQGFAINFLYEFAGQTYPIRIDEPAFPTDKSGILPILKSQFMQVDDDHAVNVRNFIVAWIKMVRNNRQVRNERIHGFGYSSNLAGDLTGLAVGGKLYRPDGSVEVAPGGDPQNVSNYTPHGKPDKWRIAFDAVCTGRVDLQCLTAAAFASPLMTFTGQPGVVLSAWGASGAGKSSALKVGAAVWANQLSLKSGTGSTPNSFIELLSDTSVMMLGWDEFQVGKATGDIVSLIMDAAQGVSKGRLDQNMKQRATRTWQSMIVISANKPIMDTIGGSNGSTDATALRAFEINILKPAMPAPAAVQLLVDDLKRHYGHTGEIYAAHVAKNMDALRQEVLDLSIKIGKKLNADSNERLYVACVATLITGAKHATDLGLCDFDVIGMTNFLLETFMKLREGRTSTSLMNNGTFDIEEVIARFASEHQGNKVVTTTFRNSGPKPANWQAFLTPPDGHPCYIHASLLQKSVRISKHAFVEWCKKNGISQTVAISSAIVDLHATQDRKVLGDGTNWSGARAAIIEFPLTPDTELLIPAEAWDYAINHIPGALWARPSQLHTTAQGKAMGLPPITVGTP